jgi:hypothetical protein
MQARRSRSCSSWAADRRDGAPSFSAVLTSGRCGRRRNRNSRHDSFQRHELHGARRRPLPQSPGTGDRGRPDSVRAATTAPCCPASSIRIVILQVPGCDTCVKSIAISVPLLRFNKPSATAPQKPRPANGSSASNTTTPKLRNSVSSPGADLDAAAPANPVLIVHRGGHTGFANSSALQRMDFDDSTPDPPGGAIIRDGQPRLTGELQEVYERLQREHPASDPRFRLEHCTLINDDLLRRIKALNAIPTPSERMSIITAKRCTSTARSG